MDTPGQARGLLAMLVRVTPGLCAKTAGSQEQYRGEEMRGRLSSTLQGRESKKAIVQGKAWGREETQEIERGQ